MARGADFESGFAGEELNSFTGSPFLSSFRRADDLAMAMRLGVIGVEMKARMKQLVMTSRIILRL